MKRLSIGEPAQRSRPDWRAWAMLAWALWFGSLYAKMVLACRADTMRLILSRLGQCLGLH